jgi:hypothetical protein
MNETEERRDKFDRETFFFSVSFNNRLLNIIELKTDRINGR